MGKRAVMSWLGIDPHMDGVTRCVHNMRGNGTNVATPRLVFFYQVQGGEVDAEFAVEPGGAGALRRGML